MKQKKAPLEGTSGYGERDADKVSRDDGVYTILKPAGDDVV